MIVGKRIEKNVLDDFLMVEDTPGAGKYIGKATRLCESDGNPSAVFDVEAIDNPDKKYVPVRAYLKSRYKAGDLTDKFMKVFNNPKSEKDVIGKKCYINVEYRGSEGSQYLTVTDIEKIK